MIDAATRRFVRERAGNCCEYCRLPQSAASFLTFHVEHIQATQHIQDDSPSNLCLACPHCNLNKGPNLSSLNPDTRETVDLFHPRKQSWDDHFRLDGARIVGKTPTGEATVRLLKMNDDEHLEIRAGLILRGEYKA